MKKIFVTVSLLLIMCLAFGVYKKNIDHNSFESNNTQLEDTLISPIEIVENFFNDFENADYEGMKTLCTPDCINIYFHDGDVFGMVWAKATSIGGEIRVSSETEYSVFVDVEMKPSEISTYSPKETGTSFYVVLKKQDDGRWLIDKFTTG